MKKIFIVVIIVAILVVVPIAIIGTDVALSIANFNPDDIDIQTSDPSYTINSDYKSATFSIDVILTTPQMGFIPKSVLVTFQILDSNGNLLSDPVSTEFPLGTFKTETITGVITLTDEYAQILQGGGKITLTLTGTVGIKYFRISIPYTYELPQNTITMP